MVDWLLNPELCPVGTKYVSLDPLAKSFVLSQFQAKTAGTLFAVFPTRTEARNAIDNLSFFAGKSRAEKIHYIPPVDFDFYRGLLPNPETLCERSIALYHALNDPNGRVFITTGGALLQKAIPTAEFLRTTLCFSPNDEIDRDFLIHALIEAGYQRQPTAFDAGVFAVRGGVFDIFSPLYPHPIRLEFYGDLIEEIRFFDVKTQLSPASNSKLDKVSILPVSLSLIPHGEQYEKAAERVKNRLDYLEIAKSKRDEVLEGLRAGQLSSEHGFLFPDLCGGASTLFEYLPKDTLYFWDGKDLLQQEAVETEIPKLKKNHELYEKALTPISSFENLFLGEGELGQAIEKSKGYFFETFNEKESSPSKTLKFEPVLLGHQREVSQSKQHELLLESFSKKFREWVEQGYRIQLVTHTRTHAGRAQMLFEPYGFKVLLQPEDTQSFQALLETDFSQLNAWQGFVSSSGIYPELKLVVLSEEEIFGKKKRTGRAASWSNSESERMLSTFRDLKESDYVVHKDFGIGRYLGLKSMNFQGTENDYVLLEYKEGDKLYIPVYRLNILQKYVGGESQNVALDKLGTDQWAKTKKKAERAIAELAAEFLNLHAKRKLVPAHSFSEPGQEYRQFEMEFPFDETPDQMKAIDAITADMSRSYPMDRLICGDVGYGKTEVAMRAAMRAVLDGKQVAILVPTTVLAFQHYQTFKERFKTTAANVEMVSRLRSTAETKKILQGLKEGKVDVLIGTHRLLSADIEFKDLGVLIVDEEHRFGVVHKERLKKMAQSVHVLSMTATPIPRTLNMAMTGIKEISIITTPPPDRLAIRTFVCRNSDEVITEAITNELAREGQVFFVHNRIESIFGVADDLKKLLPKIKIEVVHGQMEAETLEKKMLGFYQGDFSILLTTAIIESGLDIPRANTIIIDQADRFGLAQLYQLRGRVGRSERRAYCYLLVGSPGTELEFAL